MVKHGRSLTGTEKRSALNNVGKKDCLPVPARMRLPTDYPAMVFSRDFTSRYNAVPAEGLFASMIIRMIGSVPDARTSAHASFVKIFTPSVISILLSG